MKQVTTILQDNPLVLRTVTSVLKEEIISTTDITLIPEWDGGLIDYIKVRNLKVGDILKDDTNTNFWKDLRLCTLNLKENESK